MFDPEDSEISEAFLFIRMDEVKKCSDCKEIKIIDDYYNSKPAKDGKQSRCKICTLKVNKKLRDKRKREKLPKTEVILSNVTKECKACKEIKSIDLFYNTKRQEDGKFTKCKICVDNKIPVPLIPLVINGKRACSKCKENKSLKFFSKSSKEKSGYKSCCKQCILDYDRLHKVSEKRQGYRDVNKEVTNDYNKRYYSENKVELLKYCAEYSKKFPEKRKERHKNRLENDPLYRISIKISSLIGTTIRNRGFKKNDRSLAILGCTLEEFKKHIESQFLPWMSWRNSGKNVGTYDTFWQIDHIIPMCNATTEKELYLLNHWSNLQPLCAKINNEKLCDVYPVTNLELKITIVEDKQIIYND